MIGQKSNGMEQLLLFFRKSLRRSALCFLQGLEENLRESQATAQRLETHLRQKEKLYEDKIKVRSPGPAS